MILKFGIIFCAIGAQVLAAPKPCYTGCGGSSGTYTHEVASGFSTHGALTQHNAAFEQLQQTLSSQLQQSQANLNFNRPGTWNEHNAYTANDGGQVHEEHGQVENPNSKLRYFKKNYTNSWGHVAGGVDASGVNTNVLNTNANIEDFGVQAVPTSQVRQSNIKTINQWANQLESYIGLCRERLQAGQLRDYRRYETEVQQHLDRMKQQVREGGLWSHFMTQIASLEQHLNDLKWQAQQSANVVQPSSNVGAVVTGGVNQAVVSTIPVSSGGSWHREQEETHSIKTENHGYRPIATVQTVQPVVPVQPVPHHYTNGYNQGISGGYQGTVGTSTGHKDYVDYNQHHQEQTGTYNQHHEQADVYNQHHQEHTGTYNQHHQGQAGAYNHHVDSNQHNAGYVQQSGLYNQPKGQYNHIQSSGKRVEEEWNASGRRTETTFPVQTIAGGHVSDAEAAERLARYGSQGYDQGYNQGYTHGSSSSYSSGGSFSTFGSTSGGVKTDAANMAYQRGGCDNQAYGTPCRRYKREYRDYSQQAEDLTQQTEDLTQQTEDLTQQTEDLTQQTEDLAQQAQHFGQQHVGNLQSSNQRGNRGRDFTQQTQDLTQQTQDLTQQTEDLTQQTEDLTQQTQHFGQQHVGNLQSNNQRGNRGRDFTQQTQDLTQQTEDLTQQTQDLTQQTEDLTQQTQDFGQQHAGNLQSGNQRGNRGRDFTQQQSGGIEFVNNDQQQNRPGYHGHGVHGHEQHKHNDGDQHGHNDGDQGQFTQQTQGFEDHYQQQSGNIGIGNQQRQRGHGAHGHEQHGHNDGDQHGHNDGDQGQFTQQTQGFGDYYQQQHGVHGHEQHGHNDGDQVLTQQTQGFGGYHQQQGANLEQSNQHQHQGQHVHGHEQHGHNDGDQGRYNQQSQGFGNYYQQQAGQLNQQHDQQIGVEPGRYRPSQRPGALTQQTQGFEDLTQQTQGFEDLAQQTQGFENLSQQTQVAEDLTQQTQGFENLSQQTAEIEFSNKPAPKPPARNHLGHLERGDTAVEPTQFPRGVKGGRHLSPVQNTYQPAKNPNSEGVISLEDQIQQSNSNQWHNSHQPGDLTRENYEQERREVGLQNSGNETTMTDSDILFQPRILEAYGGRGPYDAHHSDNIFTGVKPNPTATLSPIVDSWDIREKPNDVIYGTNNYATFTGVPESHYPDNWETIPLTPTTTPAPGFWKRVGNKVTTTYEKAKESISHTFG